MLRLAGYVVFVSCSSLLAACGVFDAGDGDAGEDDGGAGDERCEGHEQTPASDCTNGNDPCDFDEDCAVGQKCNFAVRVCFDPASRCVGTPCTWDSDCGAGEACNSESGVCFNSNESQTCNPCFLDEDCGRTECDLDEGRCR